MADENVPVEVAEVVEEVAEEIAEAAEVEAPEPQFVGSEEDLNNLVEFCKKLLITNDFKISFEILPKAADAAHSSVVGVGLQEAEQDIPASFTIKAHDNVGNPLTHGDIPITAKVTDPEGNDVPIELVDNGDGTYEATYVPVTSGEHKIEVVISDVPVPGADPASVEVAPPTATAENSVAFGPGVGIKEAPAKDAEEAGEATEPLVVGVPAPFTIQARNRIGNDIAVGGFPFMVDVKIGDLVVPCELTDNEDGTYTGQYVPAVHGKVTVGVTLEDAPIRFSPFEIDVEKNPEFPDAVVTEATGPGVEGGRELNTAQPAVFTIQTKNPAGENLTTGGAVFIVSVKNAEGEEIPCELVDNGDGTYSGSYQPTKVEDLTVEIQLQNPVNNELLDHIQGSPFNVTVEPGIEASQCIAEGHGLNSGEMQDVDDGTFKIIAKDILGNPITEGGAPFTVEVTDPEGNAIDCDFKDNEDGTYDCCYKPDHPGKHVVMVKLAGVPIAGAPFEVEIEEGFDAEESSGFFGFTLQARNRKGEPMTKGGANMKVKVKLDEKGSDELDQVEVVDNGDGTYTCHYHIDEPGTYKISVKMNGRRLKGTPFKQECPA